MNDKQDFTALVDAVRRVHNECAAAVNRTVNTTLTLRNWLIGSYIRDYEQNGADRAQYGIHLLEKLSDSLQGCLDRCYTGRYLGLCRQLFDTYPSIRKSVISESGITLPGTFEPSVVCPETRKSWTTASSFQSTSLNCTRKRNWNASSKANAERSPKDKIS